MNEDFDILYPFHPSAEPWRSSLAFLRDCRFMISDIGMSTTLIPTVNREKSVYLQSLTTSGNTVTIIFHAVCPGGWRGDIVLTYQRGQGMTTGRVLTSGAYAVFVINSNAATPVSITPGKNAEIEPARVIWKTGGVSRILFHNEVRKENPLTRIVPETVVANSVADLSSGTVRLASGYNCALSYDAASGTLVIRGAPGAGRGTAPVGETPWDVSIGGSMPPVGTLRSINGVVPDSSGNIRLDVDDDSNIAGEKGVVRMFLGKAETNEREPLV